ncbi:MAG: tRNA (guanosine(46)-N7)-methyltransferase TrmB [Bacteroidota bacterium]|nr:tRNA (guanosine(46)-N7)-methyltransferase TrmB [Bacteroidota bacterium]
MSKKKLIHFQENLTFPHLFQPKYHDIENGFILRGRWNIDYFKNTHPIVLELGCGKGEYTVGLAQQYPDKNFIGIDLKGARLWKGSKTVAETGMKNVAFIRNQVDHVEKFFAAGEVSEIWITFPDPQVPKERKRLTSPVFLERYANVMIPGGVIHLKTDSSFFFEYTLSVIREHNHRLVYATDDLYSSGFEGPVMPIRTFYENMWLEKGKKICYVEFKMGEK